MESTIRAYLRVLKRKLFLYGLSDADLFAEIEGHLTESVAEGIKQGLNQAEAERRALARFGSIKEVSDSFYNGRIKHMQKALVGLAALAGIAAAFVDSRPTWDDMGVLLFGMLAVAGLIGLFNRRRPWLIGLAVGLWIPLYETILHHNPGAFVALGFALVGAYAGWALGLGIRQVNRPA